MIKTCQARINYSSRVELVKPESCEVQHNIIIKQESNYQVMKNQDIFVTTQNLRKQLSQVNSVRSIVSYKHVYSNAY